MHDLRAINDITEDLPADVPNLQTMLSNVPPEAKYFTVIELCSAFFSIPVAEESRHLFAFTYAGNKYTYNRLPQGFKHSPHIFNKVLKADLSDLLLESTVLQYMDDILVCSSTIEQCHKDSVAVLSKLAENGHKASKEKLQYCQSQVEYKQQTKQPLFVTYTFTAQ
ncbi:MAG: reverse transcriptase domain-containing protein [Brevinema sp.]